MAHIAIDLDDVLTDSVHRFLEFSNREWGYSFNHDDYTEDWTSMWGVSSRQAEEMSKHWHDSEAYHAGNPDPKAITVLRKLGRDHQLSIVTSRRLWVKDATEQWVNQHYPDVFDDVVFAGMWDTPGIDMVAATKAETIDRLGATILIDDQPKHCIGVAESGKQAILYGDYSWNKHLEHDKIPRCVDWKAVGNYFETL